MAAPSDVLEQLHPLRPPAPDGTLDILVMALAGCGAAAALALAFHWLRERRRPLRRAALASLAASRRLPPDDRLAAQAQILREVAVAHDAGARDLRGETWLARLDGLFSTRFFSEGPGRAFGEALYRAHRPHGDDLAAALDAELTRLLRRLDR